jgi:hypothetical protein
MPAPLLVKVVKLQELRGMRRFQGKMHAFVRCARTIRHSSRRSSVALGGRQMRLEADRHVDEFR